MDSWIGYIVVGVIVVSLVIGLNFFGPFAGYINALPTNPLDVTNITNGTPKAQPTNPGERPTPAPGQVVTTGYTQLYSFEVTKFPATMIREVPDMNRIQFDVIASVPVGFEIWRGDELIGGALNARMEHYGYVIDLYEGQGGNFTFKFASDVQGSALVVVASKAEIAALGGVAS